LAGALGVFIPEAGLGLIAEVALQAVPVVFTDEVTFGGITGVAFTVDIFTVDTLTCTVAELVWIAVTICTALGHTDCILDVESASTASIAGSVLTTGSCGLLGAVVFGVGGFSSCGAEVTFTTAEFTVTTGVIGVSLAISVVLAKSSTVAARTGVACQFGGRELALTTSVTCTTTDHTFTGTLFVRILKCGNEVTFTFDTEEVAVLAQSVACVVTAYTVYTEFTLTLIGAFTVHTIGFERLAFTLDVTESTAVAVFISEAVFGTIGLGLIGLTTTGDRT
jgi:hypothetical protein